MPVPISNIGVFDTAIKQLVFTKFGSYLSLSSVDLGVVFQPKEIAQREFAEKVGKVQSNFISIWRSNTQFSWERQRTPVGRHGISLTYTDENLKTAVTIAKAVPVDLTYEMTFWALSLDDIQKLTEEYMFWIHSNPNLELYLNGFPLDLDLHITDISDSSTIGDMYRVGKYFAINCGIKIDGWLVRFEDIKTIQQIILTGYVGKDTEKIQVFQRTFPEVV